MKRVDTGFSVYIIQTVAVKGNEKSRLFAHALRLI
jgi:hypothetical protein